jgi:hypothetical protein
MDKLLSALAPAITGILTPRTSSAESPYAAYRLAEFLKLPEREYTAIIAAIETNPFVEQLMYPCAEEECLLAYNRFPDTDLSPHFWHMMKPSGLIRAFPWEKIIARIGFDDFKRFFLYREARLNQKQVAGNTGLSVDEVCAIQKELLYGYSGSGCAGELVQEKRISAAGDEYTVPVLLAYAPALARGIYKINARRLAVLLRSKQTAHVTEIIRLMELVNLRKQIMYRTIKQLVEFQSAFISSGDKEQLLPLTQSALARSLCLDKSLVCRAISNRSVNIRGEEMPLKDLVPSKKRIGLMLMRKLIAQERRIATDNELQKKMFSRYNIRLSRRSISMYRKSLAIPSSFDRVVKNTP